MTLIEAPERARRVARTDTHSWLNERIPQTRVAIVAAAWAVFVLLMDLLAPESSHHEATPWYVTAVSVGLLAVLGVMLVGLLLKRRWALLVSLGAAGFLIADAVLCPVSGHHDLGLFVYAQGAAAIALTGMSFGLLRAR